MRGNVKVPRIFVYMGVYGGLVGVLEACWSGRRSA